MLVALYFT